MKDCGVVIVAYNPDATLDRLVNACSKEFTLVAVIFNSPALTDFDSYGNVVVVQNNDNVGLSKGLNQGVQLCIDHASNLKWCVTFDQDTEILSNFSRVLEEQIEILGDQRDETIIGQNYINHDRSKKAYATSGFIRLNRPIVTSGTAYPLKIFQDIGFFDEQLFIEGIDTEFCLRILDRNRSIYVGSEVAMIHGSGNDQSVNLLGRVINVSGHSPYRFYLQWRNNIYAHQKYSKGILPLLVTIGPNLLKNLIVTILFETNRIAKLRQCVLGFLDGFKGDLTR